MMLRTIVLVIVALLTVAAAVATLANISHVGALIAALVVLGGIIFERRRYGAAQAIPIGPGWHATDERFIDEEGVPVRVWFNPISGERRYVADSSAPR